MPIAGIHSRLEESPESFEAAAVALAPIPKGFSLTELAQKVSQIIGTSYSIRQAAYDSKKLRSVPKSKKPGMMKSIVSHTVRIARLKLLLFRY